MSLYLFFQVKAQFPMMHLPSTWLYLLINTRK